MVLIISASAILLLCSITFESSMGCFLRRVFAFSSTKTPARIMGPIIGPLPASSIPMVRVMELQI